MNWVGKLAKTIIVLGILATAFCFVLFGDIVVPVLFTLGPITLILIPIALLVACLMTMRAKTNQELLMLTGLWLTLGATLAILSSFNRFVAATLLVLGIGMVILSKTLKTPNTSSNSFPRN